MRVVPMSTVRRSAGTCVRPTGEEAADGRVRGLRLLFEEEVAGAVDGDDFGAGEALAKAVERKAREDALVGGPEDEERVG